MRSLIFLDTMKTSSDDSKGLSAAIACYILWGLVPIFWKQLVHIPALELINHRVIWSVVILLVIIIAQKRFKAYVKGFLSRKSFLTLLLTTILISTNWLIFIWAVNANHILDTSLGYYINPILNIFLGSLILKERLSKLQKWAVAVAAAGVLSLIVSIGYLPWISLVIALSFALYGFVRKIAPMDPVIGLAQEATLLLAPALGYLYYLESQGQSSFGHNVSDSIMLFMCGVITTVPLLLFLFSLKRIKLSTIGILQFITPTTTFFLAIFYYNEPFEIEKLFAFVLIWLSVGMYISDLRLKGQKPT